YHRTLDSRVGGALVAKKTRDGRTAACSNPLWSTLAAEELNLVDVAFFEEAERRFSHLSRDDDRIVASMLSLVDEMPATIDGLYDWVLRRTERYFGTMWTGAFVGLVAVSRDGWRESDLRSLMPQLAGETWDDLRFATLRRSLRAHTVHGGAQAHWRFAHEQMRRAVLNEIS